MKRITKITLLTALLFVSVSSLPTAVAEKPVQFGLTAQPIFPCGALKPSFRVGPSVECILPDNLQLIPRIQAIIEAHVMLAGHSKDSSLASHEKGQMALNVQPDLGVKPMPDNPWFPKMSWRPYLSYGSAGMNCSLVQFGLQWKHKNCRISLIISRVPTGTPAGGETTDPAAVLKAKQEVLKKVQQEEQEAKTDEDKQAAKERKKTVEKDVETAQKVVDNAKAVEDANKVVTDKEKAQTDAKQAVKDAGEDETQKQKAQEELTKAAQEVTDAKAALKTAEDAAKKAAKSDTKANPQSAFWKGWNVGVGFTWYF